MLNTYTHHLTTHSHYCYECNLSMSHKMYHNHVPPETCTHMCLQTFQVSSPVCPLHTAITHVAKVLKLKSLVTMAIAT